MPLLQLDVYCTKYQHQDKTGAFISCSAVRTFGLLSSEFGGKGPW